MTPIASKAVIFIALSYLLGSVPFAVILARLFGGKDPRTIGSGNVGATNVVRSAGKVAGALTLVADIFKGAVPVYLAYLFMPYLLDGQRVSVHIAQVFASLVGFAAFAGHLFPVFLRFKGGKGVATACGVMFVISPVATLLSMGVFIFFVAIKRYVSLGSIFAAASMPIFIAFLPGKQDYVILSVLISALVIYKHKENIKRLVAGTENKI